MTAYEKRTAHSWKEALRSQWIPLLFVAGVLYMTARGEYPLWLGLPLLLLWLLISYVRGYQRGYVEADQLNAMVRESLLDSEPPHNVIPLDRASGE